MYISRTYYIIYAAILLSLLSASAFAVNFFSYHYPGNNYFPPNIFFIALSLMLMYAGFALQFGPSSYLAATIKETIYFFLVMCVLALSTNAAQYTPFPTIDKHIVGLEASLHIDMQALISWTHTKPMLKKLLEFIYNTLPFQMTYFPILLIIMKRWDTIREYYFLLLVSAIIGFSFYYFFPTTAPASIIPGHYFSEAQRATGLKFIQIHQHIQPSTIDGGLIALPSFHVIWAWFCLYILRSWPVALVIMLPINSLLIASCVLLGWHYPIDILGGIIVIMITHWVIHSCSFFSAPSTVHETHRWRLKKQEINV